MVLISEYITMHGPLNVKSEVLSFSVRVHFKSIQAQAYMFINIALFNTSIQKKKDHTGNTNSFTIII